jgi:hypothetical protein
MAKAGSIGASVVGNLLALLLSCDFGRLAPSMPAVAQDDQQQRPAVARWLLLRPQLRERVRVEVPGGLAHEGRSWAKTHRSTDGRSRGASITSSAREAARNVAKSPPHSDTRGAPRVSAFALTLRSYVSRGGHDARVVSATREIRRIRAARVA